jgi:hypothetical protein
VSDAEVAETAYTAFTSKKNKAITARLIVRRVKDLKPQSRRRPRRAARNVSGRKPTPTTAPKFQLLRPGRRKSIT